MKRENTSELVERLSEAVMTSRIRVALALATSVVVACGGSTSASTGTGASGPTGSTGPSGPVSSPAPSPSPPSMAAVNVDLQGSGAVDVISNTGVQSCNGSCVTQVVQGSTVLLIPHPGDGFTFQGFQGNLCNGSAVQGSNDCNLTVNGNLTIVVAFVAVPTPPPSKHTLVVNRTGNGICVVVATSVGLDCGTDCQRDVDVDVDVVLAVQPDKDSAFTGWKGGTCDGSKDPTCTVHMDKDVTVSARCMKIVCSVDP